MDRTVLWDERPGFKRENAGTTWTATGSAWPQPTDLDAEHYFEHIADAVALHD
jgi:hypothetical protein